MYGYKQPKLMVSVVSQVLVLCIDTGRSSLWREFSSQFGGYKALQVQSGNDTGSPGLWSQSLVRFQFLNYDKTRTYVWIQAAQAYGVSGQFWFWFLNYDKTRTYVWIQAAQAYGVTSQFWFWFLNLKAYWLNLYRQSGNDTGSPSCWCEKLNSLQVLIFEFKDIWLNQHRGKTQCA